jgi:hypothetical protein
VITDVPKASVPSDERGPDVSTKCGVLKEIGANVSVDGLGCLKFRLEIELIERIIFSFTS